MKSKTTKEGKPKSPREVAKLLREIVIGGTLNKVPKSWFTNAAVLHAGSEGYNTIHYAAFNGFLDHIPKKFLTLENLSKRTKNGWNCFHLAAFNGWLKQMPRELLTKKNLIVKSKGGESALHYAARGGTLTDVPAEVLRPENMVLPTPKTKKELSMFTSRDKKVTETSLTIHLSKGGNWPELIPKYWVKNLEELKNLSKLTFPSTNAKEIEKQREAFVEKVEAAKRLQEMPALKL